MAAKKREGIEGLKSTTGGKRRDDRQVIGRTYFDPINIDAKNALTVIYLLRSPEDNVMLRAVASLEVFGRKDPENFKLLCSLGIFEYVYPLINHSDYIVRRFTLKLLGMLCGLKEFRQQMLEVEGILETFVEILRTETDAVLQEFAALILAELSKDYQAASNLLKVNHCVDTLFEKIVSLDPDIEKNCLDIMIELLNTVNGIETFVDSPGFDIKLLLNLTTSSYPVIQNLAIEILRELTSMCRNEKVLVAFRDAKGIEVILSILQNEEWSDLHKGILDLLVNLVDRPEICDFLPQSGCLTQLLNLLDMTSNLNFIRRILGILARMSQTKTGALALLAMEIDTRFVDFLSMEDVDEIVQMQSSLGIANLAKFTPISGRTWTKNPIPKLAEIIVDREKNLNLRNMAAYALNCLTKMDKKLSEGLLQNNLYQDLYNVLLENSQLPTEFCQNLIQVFIGIAQYYDIKNEFINDSFLAALISCLPSVSGNKDPSLHVEALECLSEYMNEKEARSIFASLNGAEAVTNCLNSNYAAVREWAGHLVTLAGQDEEFVKNFIRKGGLNRLLKEKNTRYSMPSWHSAIETIFENHLPAKFAYTGRLDFQDITQDGFYIYASPRAKFILIEELIYSKVSPIIPLYFAYFNLSYSSFDDGESDSVEERVSDGSFGESLNENEPEKHVLGVTQSAENQSSDKTASSTCSDVFCNLGKFLPDPYLRDYLETLQRKIRRDDSLIGDLGWHNLHPELISRRVKLIAQLVANEMSGPEPDLSCHSTYKEAHMMEMKIHLGTNIIPLGAIRMGSYLERAMLFKVLADKIGFPCALVRGGYGRAWIEIAIPVINVEEVQDGSLNKMDTLLACSDAPSTADNTIESGRTQSSNKMQDDYRSPSPNCFWYPELQYEDFKCFPLQYLKPNAIVDLIDEPGRIIGIHSLEAENYCGTYLFSVPQK